MSSIQELVNRAETDASFRSQFIQDATAVCRELAVDLPAGAMVELIDIQPNEIHLNLGGKGAPTNLQNILDKAKSDPGFRTQLLDNPKVFLEQAFGSSLAATAKVCVHAQPKPGVVRLFLAPLRADQPGELSDAELDTVAGGGLFAAIREWICKDRVVITWDTPGNEQGTTTYTSHNSPGHTTSPIVVL